MTKPNEITVTFKVSSSNFAENDGEYSILLDLTGLTDDDWNQYALRSIVIGLQSTIRGKGDTAKNFDASKTFKVPAPGTRINTDPEKRIKKAKEAISLLNKMSPEELMEVYKSAGIPIPEALLAKVA